MGASERWIPFFLKGSFQDSQERPYESTDEKLSMVLAANKGRTVPLAIGHPKGNAPAVGWVDDYKRKGDLLFARVKKLVPSFEAEVKSGVWGKISASVTADGLLNHIGFFGTQPTAMDGIPLVEFSAAENSVEIVFDFSAAEFSGWETTSRINDIGALFGRLRDWIISKGSIEEADKVLSSYDIDRLKAMQPEVEPVQSSAFSVQSLKTEGGGTMKTVEELETELAAAKSQIAEFSKTSEKVIALETELAREKKKTQVQEFSTFLGCDEMKKKVSPAMRPAMIDFMQCLSATEAYEFSAAEGKTEKKSPVVAFQEFAKTFLPDILTTEAIATGKKAAGEKTAPHEFMGKVAEFAKEHNISEGAAVIEIAHANPDLHREWLASVNK